MHEATIANSILDIVSARVAAHPRTAARSIVVLVGEFRNVEADCLRFAFDSLKETRPGCAQCELTIEFSPLVAKCEQNQHVYKPSEQSFYRCNCGSGIGEIIQGQELDIIGCTLIAMPEEFVCMN